MSSENFQLLDNEQIDNGIVKRDFFKIYHQQGAEINNPHQNIDFFFGENNKYHQLGNSNFQFVITVQDPNAGLINKAEKRPVNIGFAFCFNEATISTTGDMEIEPV